MDNSITYPTVSGSDTNGAHIAVAVGDYLTARTHAGRLVSGRVIATHPYYPSVTIDGVEFRDAQVIPNVRASVLVRDVLTHEPAGTAQVSR